MSGIREFFEKKKAALKFKKAGPGHKLTESASQARNPQPITTQPTRHQRSEGAQRAGAAALARVEQKPNTTNWSIQATRAQARREIELESATKAKEASAPRKDLVVHEDCPFTVSGVYFKCPMIGPEVLPRKEIKEKIRQFLYEQLELERGLTACLIIYTLNENKEKVRSGIETLVKYLTNILDNPEENKYRRIRFNNKVFQERIASLEGAFDFLTAAGFSRQTEGGEEYFVFDEALLEDTENLQKLIEALLDAERIVPTLDRNLKVLRPAEAAGSINLPHDFFHITADELKREQEAKAETVELMTQLRTKAMRERDEIRGDLHAYKYTLVRIRFPDGIILQGTFYVHERLSTVKEFIVENLCDPQREFNLLLPGCRKLTENGSLLELKLVPAVLLNFLWSNGTANETEGFLKPETMALLADL